MLFDRPDPEQRSTLPTAHARTFDSYFEIFIFSRKIILGIVQCHPHSPPGDQRSMKHGFPSQETFASNREQRQLPASRTRETRADEHQSRMAEPGWLII